MIITERERTGEAAIRQPATRREIVVRVLPDPPPVA